MKLLVFIHGRSRKVDNLMKKKIISVLAFIIPAIFCALLVITLQKSLLKEETNNLEVTATPTAIPISLDLLDNADSDNAEDDDTEDTSADSDNEESDADEEIVDYTDALGRNLRLTKKEVERVEFWKEHESPYGDGASFYYGLFDCQVNDYFIDRDFKLATEQINLEKEQDAVYTNVVSSQYLKGKASDYADYYTRQYTIGDTIDWSYYSDEVRDSFKTGAYRNELQGMYFTALANEVGLDNVKYLDNVGLTPKYIFDECGSNVYMFDDGTQQIYYDCVSKDNIVYVADYVKGKSIRTTDHDGHVIPNAIGAGPYAEDLVKSSNPKDDPEMIEIKVDSGTVLSFSFLPDAFYPIWTAYSNDVNQELGIAEASKVYLALKKYLDACSSAGYVNTYDMDSIELHPYSLHKCFEGYENYVMEITVNGTYRTYIQITYDLNDLSTFWIFEPQEDNEWWANIIRENL